MPNTHIKILNFGSLNIDYVYQVKHFVSAGETLSSNCLEIFEGGKGLNQSIALARAGAEVYHAGLIGKDGVDLINALNRVGVNTDFIGISDIKTGHAIIQVDSHGQNCILLFSGANKQIDEPFIERVFEKFTQNDILVISNEINCLTEIIEYATQKKMKIFFNPSPMDSSVKDLPLDKITYFFINEIEGANITGKNRPDDIIREMCRLYPDTHVILTLGGEGSIYAHKGKTFKSEALKVNAVDTTAAGDTFMGFFIACLISGKEIKECMDIASSAAALAITRLGASPSIPTLSQVDRFIGNNYITEESQ